ncbi:hypothetical protein [Nocardioides sp. Soil805]|uniref:hypothetical protein n=1 Tax=Nocardioides sp. Soil805 TaxID=1736416 RepID=UPI000702EEC3|nr:hypothetical protein [Nocardioides sp. Soil805]KRF28135.1 hypothetical protein ASG94_21135 [Nocardioides sp. Soil805]
MADHPSAQDHTEEKHRGSGEARVRPDLTLLLAVHHGLRRDLRHFLDHVDGTPVAERGRWEALCARWDLFAVLVQHCFQWERLHLWPLLSAAVEEGSRLHVEATLAITRRRADSVEAMIESSRPVFERLAHTRDEDALATLRARVRAACGALEESLDCEEDDVVPLMRRHVASRAWKESQHRLFETAPREVRGHGLPWLVHELPLETATVVAAGWNDRADQELSASAEAFRELETWAFGGVSPTRPGV